MWPGNEEDGRDDEAVIEGKKRPKERLQGNTVRKERMVQSQMKDG